MNFLSELSQLHVASAIQKSAAEYIRRGFPSKQTEEWRYTSLKPLSEADLQSAVSSKLLLNTSLKIEDLKLESSAKYFRQDFFDQLSLLNPHKLQRIEIPPSKTEYIGLENIIENGEYFNSVLVIDLMPHSKLTLNCSSQVSGGFANTKIILNMEANSQCEVLASYKMFSRSFAVSTFESYQKKHATLRFISLAKGSDLLRQNISCSLLEEGASSEINGFNLLKESLSVDCNVHSNHLAPHTTSRQFFKTILSENSKSVFQGRIYIEKQSQKSDAEQLSRSLMLSKKCTVDTKPQLDVYADDVKANHGAAIGQLDANEMFYLQSRGLSKEQSLNLLISAYGLEIVDKLQSTDLRKIAKSYLSGQGDLS